MTLALRARPARRYAAAVRSAGGVGRSRGAYAERVSDALRRQTGPDLSRRRAAVALSLVSIAALGVVEAYQTGLVRHLPEPSLPGLDADRVDASGEAYQLFGTPDAGLGIASYGATLALLGAGTSERAAERPWLVLAAAAKVAADAVGGGYLFAEQVSRHRRVCSWCTLAPAASAATVPLVVPEARRAWRQLLRG